MIKHVFVRKVYSAPVCPVCREKMQLDDLDIQFQGCQDEYHICTKCCVDARTKVRYDNIVKIVYTDSDGNTIKVEKPCNEFK